MNIAWITPMGAQSAIASYSVAVTAALAEQGCHVRLLASDDPPWRDAARPITPLGTAAGEHALRHASERVYNIGDHARFCRRAYEALIEIPGLVVLHDRAYQSLFSALWLTTAVGSEMYRQRMARYYGEAGRNVVEHSFSGKRAPIWESPVEWQRYPLDDELLSGATGALVHSESHRIDVARRWLGPVARISFPSYGPPPAEPRNLRVDSRVVLVTFGHLNPNKQVPRVLRAIHDSGRLRSLVRYVVAGPCDAAYELRLRRLVAELSLEDVVELKTGFQPDAVLRELCSSADAFVNLREPPLESASASLIEQLNSGKPSIVSNNGARADLPSDCVVLVAEGDDEALKNALHRVVEDPVYRRRVGARAATVAAELTPERTAREILDFCRERRRWTPVFDLIDRVATELDLMSVPDTSPSIVNVAAQVTAICARL
jgi:glycosyltransferase involved in cell wall biosynthesis